MKRIITSLFTLIVAFTMILGLTSCKSEEEKLVDQPSESYIIECLQKVPCIIEIEAVTEDNDPIGQLNKPGGYTALVYFSYELVDQDEVYGDDLIDKGTDAGGCIEVYTTEKDANKRNEYLAAFDGGVLTSGSHTVVGTIVVRTSDELTATQQKLLESNIIAALQGQDDKIVAPKTNSNNNDSNDDSDNDDDPPAQPSGNTKEDAVNDAEKFANEFTTEYPNDYLTPNYILEYLRDVLGYSETIAVYATENCNISWTTHAKKYAQVYLTYEEEFGRPASWWNPSDIEDMLLEDGFSYDTVEATMATIDWTAQSKKYVKHLSDFYDTFNRLDARGYLEDIAANEAGVNYLLENSGVNWKQHALNMANELWAEYSSQGYYEDKTVEFILTDIREELSSIWEYTQVEIDYAIQNITIDRCRHTNLQTLSAVAATCTSTGLTEGKKCKDCGETIIEQSTIPASHTEVIDDAVPATCKSNGLTEGKHCSKCNTTLVPQETTDLAWHTFEKEKCKYCSIEEHTQGLVFELNTTDNSYTVTDYNGSSSTIKIPASYLGVPVKCIGQSAFSYQSKITAVEIPNSIKTLELWAFVHCKGLVSIDIPDSVTTIGNQAFLGCNNLQRVIIGNGVTSIGSSSFAECPLLSSVSLGNSLSTMGQQAFRECTALKTIVLPNSLTKIPSSAFINCSNLETVTFSNNITVINSSAFKGCAKLKNVVLPNKLNALKIDAFEGCSSITDIVIPSSVTSIDAGVFNGCTNLKTVKFETEIFWYSYPYANSKEGTLIDVTDPGRNANNLVNGSSYWKLN